MYREATLNGKSAATSAGHACPEDKSKAECDNDASDATSGVEESSK